MPAWLIWLIAAGVLAAAETQSGDFVLVMLAGGALGGGLAGVIGLPVAVQVIVAVVVAVALLVGVRPVVKRHLHLEAEHPMNAAALVGKKAVVLQKVDEHGGRVRLNGAEWSARSFDERQVIDAGTAVQVMKIDGATAVVWEGP